MKKNCRLKITVLQLYYHRTAKGSYRWIQPTLWRICFNKSFKATYQYIPFVLPSLSLLICKNYTSNDSWISQEQMLDNLLTINPMYWFGHQVFLKTICIWERGSHRIHYQLLISPSFRFCLTGTGSGIRGSALKIGGESACVGGCQGPDHLRVNPILTGLESDHKVHGVSVTCTQVGGQRVIWLMVVCVCTQGSTLTLHM